MTAVNPVTDLAQDGDVAVITLNSPPVNALSAVVRQGLHAALTAAIASPAKAILLICEGRTFVAGADITELGTELKPPLLRDIQEVMENATKPVIAALHGTALGGGLELAICAHYRVAVPSAKLGLPEVNLGLLPGAGGTQRLPRIVGPQKALEVMTGGRPVTASDAAAMGLIDEIEPEGQLRAAALAFAHRIIAEAPPLTRVRDREDAIAPVRGDPAVFLAFRAATAQRFRGQQAPENIIQCVEAAVNLPFEEGLAAEKRLFQELISGEQSKARRYYFFAERAAQKAPDVTPATPVREIRRIGVVGAGLMGGGIAMCFANAGLSVTLVETRQEALDRGLGVIRGAYERSRGASREQTQARLDLLRGSLDLADLADCDLVVEAIFENLEAKTELFARLDQLCKPGAILASNTSFLNLDEIARATSRPSDCIGLHFFSPAQVMPLLEIVRGEKTATDVLATALALGKTLRKVVVVSGVGPGFIANRVAGARTREINAFLLDGLSPARVDKVLYDFGFSMGPFAMMDLVGLDVVADRPGEKTIRSWMVEAGRRGQKSGGGFYDYDASGTPQASPEAEAVIARFRAAGAATTRDVTDAEILERSLYLEVNEGAKVLEEGIAMRASDIDVALINGYGWPSYRGGPMFYADQVGLAQVVARLKAFEAKYGPRYRPAALLERLAAEGRTLTGQS
jgi:3-hydroxyacyl-CoA dehydrogenase